MSQVSAPSTSTCITGTLKWFNFRKGYGFLVRHGSEDVMILASTLRQANVWVDQVRPGVSMTVEVARSPYGLRASRLIEISEWKARP